ncbi:uncharacterized protein LOC115694955 [Cannabis sativa]|uniref:uncharacterized protein LOC115694955 n=1 Tax=Cannabis sativa TaxID=3483 RepID=UPI0011E01D7A|nr:uncharacterized protein LOC115694955 [Cannabis sativa]
MFDEYGIKMSYEKAWRCREKAVMYKRGTPAKSYTKLYGYFYMLEQKNPGTITDIVSEDDRFKYCFWSLDACRRGFKFFCPVISIDGTFLKTKYGGTLLVVVAYDANNLLFSVAYAIVDTCHCACFKHITKNVIHKFKTGVCNRQIWRVAYAWNKTECDRHFKVLKQMDPAIATYVEKIGFEKWARPYCPCDQYNIMTSNAAESFNRVTEEFRKYPFASRLEKASKCATPLATTFENDLEDKHKDGMFRSVLRNGAQLFNVGTSPQAVSQNVSVYALNSPYYTKETWKKIYDATINIVGKEDEWVLPEHIKNIRIGVPVEKKPVGRPRKRNAGRRPMKRRPSSGQVVVEPRNCSICHGPGHNRATCKARV